MTPTHTSQSRNPFSVSHRKLNALCATATLTVLLGLNPALAQQTTTEEKPEDKKFDHGIEAINQFEAIKLLPPNNPTEIDSTIKLIKDKIDFYSNPTEEEKNAFK